LKTQISCGSKTGIVTSVRITKSYGKGTADTNHIVPLLERTQRNGWNVSAVCADKGYLSRENVDAIRAAGAIPYIPFKDDSTCIGQQAWRDMWHAYMFHREQWLKKYHHRSKAENVFSATKAKFGGGLRSRLWEAQVNECLLKFLCHNLSVVVRSIHEVGLEPTFWKGR
jgi:transposase